MSGGLNLRFIHDNLVLLVSDLIDDSDWNDTGRHNLSVAVVSDHLDPDEEIKPNLISVVPEDILHSDAEVGSNLTNQRITFAIDILAESHAVGLHLAGDITTYFQALYNFPVLNLAQATPTPLFYCDIEGVVQERNRLYENKRNKFWWVVSFHVVRSDFSSDL